MSKSWKRGTWNHVRDVDLSPFSKTLNDSALQNVSVICNKLSTLILDGCQNVTDGTPLLLDRIP